VRGFRRLLTDQGGNTAMIFGLAVIPLIALSGGAVDLSTRTNVRAGIQSASDAAALAAARTLQAGQRLDGQSREELEATARANAQQMFRASMVGFANVSNTEPVIEIVGGRVRVTADVDVRTSFLGLVGIDHLATGGLAEVNVPDPMSVEIALVLDYSGSMAENNKYARMTTAAKTFIGKVAADRTTNTKIGIVPFSDYVYATLPGSNIRDTNYMQANHSTTACLLNRDYPYSASADEPHDAIAASQWPQADPDSSRCQAYSSGGLRMRDLTNDFAGLSTALDGMRPLGYTNIALAAEMGWHLLTPEAPFDTAQPPSEATLRKVMILLTDGVQTVQAGGPGGGYSTVAADETTAELCENADDAGILIFTIAYDISEDRVRDLLSGCASSADAFHEAQDETQIGAVFEEIFAQLTESVWLSR
jgi:Flp pilus assembly protein TadG